MSRVDCVLSHVVAYYQLNSYPWATGSVVNTQNPTEWPNEIGYAVAWAYNRNDDSGTLWTAQTTGADVG